MDNNNRRDVDDEDDDEDDNEPDSNSDNDDDDDNDDDNEEESDQDEDAEDAEDDDDDDDDDDDNEEDAEDDDDEEEDNKGEVLDGGVAAAEAEIGAAAAVAGPPVDPNAARPLANTADIVLFLTCAEIICTDAYPNGILDHPVLKPGVTVQIGMSKNTRLSAVMQRYVDYVNDYPLPSSTAATGDHNNNNNAKNNAKNKDKKKNKKNDKESSKDTKNKDQKQKSLLEKKEKIIQMADLEFVHATVLQHFETAEQAALMKDDRIRVRAERSRQVQEEKEGQRLQRELDAVYFAQLSQMRQHPSSSSILIKDISSKNKSNPNSPIAMLDCRGSLPTPPAPVAAASAAAMSARPVVPFSVTSSSWSVSIQQQDVNNKRRKQEQQPQNTTRTRLVASRSSSGGLPSSLKKPAAARPPSPPILSGNNDGDDDDHNDNTNKNDPEQHGNKTTVPCHVGLVAKRCPWLGRFLATARVNALRKIQDEKDAAAAIHKKKAAAAAAVGQGQRPVMQIAAAGVGVADLARSVVSLTEDRTFLPEGEDDDEDNDVRKQDNTDGSVPKRDDTKAEEEEDQVMEPPAAAGAGAAANEHDHPIQVVEWANNNGGAAGAAAAVANGPANAAANGGGDRPLAAAEIENDDDEDMRHVPQVAVDNINNTTGNANKNGDMHANEDNAGDDSNKNNADSVLWVTIEDHPPEAVELLLEYCYTNRVVSLGMEAFKQAAHTKAAPRELKGNVPPFPISGNGKKWPKRGEPTISFGVALASLQLAEDAQMPRFSLMCQVAAAQLVTSTLAAIQALTTCQQVYDSIGHSLGILRQAAMDIVLHSKPASASFSRSSFSSRDNTLRHPSFVHTLTDKSAGPYLVPTLLQGTVEAMERLMDKKAIHDYEQVDWKSKLAAGYDKIFKQYDDEDAMTRRIERERRRKERKRKEGPYKSVKSNDGDDGDDIMDYEDYDDGNNDDGDDDDAYVIDGAKKRSKQASSTASKQQPLIVDEYDALHSRVPLLNHSSSISDATKVIKAKQAARRLAKMPQQQPPPPQQQQQQQRSNRENNNNAASTRRGERRSSRVAKKDI